MRILLLGIESDVLDEGAQNVANNLARTLARRHEVLMIHQRKAVAPKHFLAARRFSPDILLSVHGPSPRTLALLAMLRLFAGCGRTAVLAAQPHEYRSMRWIARLLKPSMGFAQSNTTLKLLARAGWNVSLLPNGVDTDKFAPRHSPQVIREVRDELGISLGTKMALHVGPLNSNRGHELLAKLAKESDWQVVVIGSTTTPCVPEVVQFLDASGVKVHRRYFPDISRLYAAADAYIFPVQERSGSIEFPLTILEAMACDCPVVTTPFRGLPDFISESESFHFFQNYEELRAALPRVIGKRGNRQIAVGFDWREVVKRLERNLETAPLTA